MASKRALRKEIERLETEVANERGRTAVAEQGHAAALRNLHDAVDSGDRARNDLAQLRRDHEESIADVKAAWNHDKAQRDEAQRELTELRRQLAKIREKFTPLQEAIHPPLLKGGVFGGPTLPGVSWNG